MFNWSEVHSERNNFLKNAYFKCVSTNELVSHVARFRKCHFSVRKRHLWHALFVESKYLLLKSVHSSMFCSSHFWFLVTYSDKVTKIPKYYVIFVYILQGKMCKTEKIKKKITQPNWPSYQKPKDENMGWNNWYHKHVPKGIFPSTPVCHLFHQLLNLKLIH